ncbi:peptidoglycan-associated lipoprotein Pal [Solimicrobium silvestre]|uniref:Peptidoglycan-associated lipoprotein n=1 Tax=Solimicrobium silvestre TaxID=2099400 RepID=A0A2S9H5L4_9BURK|nr:peptidoglycan-associated lipoprotein Pal [Solimicrobium silvestre]PRC95272.1 Peptidoglycan-associated lipoprotein [Solimicrobium silvestre]
MNSITSKLVLAMAAAALMSACSTPVKVEEKAPVAEAPAPVVKAPEVRAVQPVVAEIDPLNDPKGVLANRSVYFDFDKYTVKDEATAMLSAHAKYLASHTARKVLVQGNTDERGGREYNLALGQKRAVAVTKSLTTLGASASQIEAVSLGKEKPKATGNNEAAWAENRRADIVY